MLNVIVLGLSLFIIQFASSCRKEPRAIPVDLVAGQPAMGDTTEVSNPTEDKEDDNGGNDDSHIITVGSADGKTLTIDGKKLDAAPGTEINIREAIYNSITIKNVAGTAEHPIIIRNNGTVIIRDRMETENISHVIISGDGEPTIPYGFRFLDIPYRAIMMAGIMNFVTLRNIDFTNVKDYCITTTGENHSNKLAYRNTPDSKTTGFKILHCRFDNTGPIVFDGYLNNEDDRGLFSNVEIAHNQFQNSNAGSLVVFGNVEDFNIHDNIVNNVNLKNNNHNGVFYMQGNGTFHHNKLTNYQGNAIRLWPFSRGNTPKTVEIHHNICYNTVKYGAFEIQAFADRMIPGKTTFVNAKVYNNTVGKMNTSKDWDGQLLDLYSMQGGSLEYYNNLGFELYSQGKITNMINMGGPKITKNINNVYKSSGSDAVFDTEEFISKIDGVGAK